LRRQWVLLCLGKSDPRAAYLVREILSTGLTWSQNCREASEGKGRNPRHTQKTLNISVKTTFSRNEGEIFGTIPERPVDSMGEEDFSSLEERSFRNALCTCPWLSISKPIEQAKESRVPLGKKSRRRITLNAPKRRDLQGCEKERGQAGHGLSRKVSVRPIGAWPGSPERGGSRLILDDSAQCAQCAKRGLRRL